MERLRERSKRALTLFLAIVMILTSLPLDVLAKVNYDDLSNDQPKIVNKKVPVKVAKPEAGKKAEDLIKNPEQPAIYTLRTDFKVQRGEKYYVDYQPYIASVGAAATADEQKKVDKTINMPKLAGYDEPQDNFTINYNTVKNAADGKNKTGNDANGLRYSDEQEFRYTAKSSQIKIKHVFQALEDFTKYTNPDGSVGETGELITTQNGNTGSTMEVSPLNKNDPRVKGFVQEAASIIIQVPENAENFILEYRYNRAHYNVVFDTAGGTELPVRTLYYGQVIPKIADESIPTKAGGDFLGWKPSVELTTKNGKTYKANEIIKVGTNEASKNLDANLIMPASNVTFTAVWKDKEKADYAVQFWAEKADHADGAGLEKYDYIGTRVYKDQDTGLRPDIDNVSVKDIVFPDLDQARLQKIWNGTKFNQDKYLYLNKFYVCNKNLTHDQNKDPKNVNLVKSVDSTGKTVYNIYYDRQVYNLYFTKSNVVGSAFYPEISKDGKEVGKEGNPYHFKARFNQSMVGLWPDDVKEVRGFAEGNNSLGWLPNLKKPKHFYRDTPPYRLSANLFIDFPELKDQDGYASEIDLGNGGKKPASITDLSFGIDQNEQTMPHQIDFWLDGFDGEPVIDYDLYTIKSDTDNSNYHDFLPPDLQGFTPKNSGGRGSEFKDDSDLDDLNEEREEITPFPEVYSKELDENDEPKQKGKLYFMRHFPGDDKEFDQNGYLKFEYSRNKYPLRFNYDPTIIRDESYFNANNSLETFYEFPLKALNPKADTEKSYKTGNPKNILDNPEKLQELGLTDLVFTDPKDGKLKVKRPKGLSDQMAFKGWALDPAGTKLIRDNGSEKMPSHPVNLYAKWGEPDYKWKVTFDPNGGNLRNIKEEDLTTERKKIQEGDIGQEETNTYAKKEKSVGDKQVFTVIQRQKLVEPKYKPTKKGYNFMGWEVIRYKKDANTGEYTNEQDTSYRDTYKVPELYSFGNDVVAPIYLKAIWVPNDRVDVKVEHYFLDKDFNKDTSINKNPDKDTLTDKRAGYLVATIGDRQNDKYILATDEELTKKLTGDLKTLYEEYNKRVNANNTFFQQFRVEPEKKLNPETNQVEANPDVKNNVFKFFYKPFRTRQYKVNYIDERFKGKETEEGAAIIDQELVSNGNRHFDARNYRPIPGWKLVSAPQQQLFFDVDEKTNEFLGINGTGKDEITFYYKDVRVIEVPNKDDPVPDGYVRVTFKADKGGSFGKDAQGKDITELHYDVIKGLKSDLLPVPGELKDGEEKVADKYYITPETGKKFIKWDEKPLLNKNTIVDNDTKDFYVFTAKFEWSGLSASGLVRTEAFKDPNGNWTNDFAPTIEQLKAQLVWKEKDKVKDLPEGTTIQFFDEKDNEIKNDEDVFKLVSEQNKADKDETVRTINIKAKVTFKDGKQTQELTIPIIVYKNVYEALNKDGDKPLFLTEAEGKDAKDGGLRDVTGKYVKVIVQPTEKNTNKDAKVYYVNPKAWVIIPEVEWSDADKDKHDFLKWTSDKETQNEEGKFDFAKRHKFTDEETTIKPIFTDDVVEQEKGKEKPKVPDNFKKVIVKTTDKATDETAFEKTFWVNPTKEVTIDVKNPTGKKVEANTVTVGAAGYTWDFSKWETEDKAKAWEDKIVGKFEKETTILAKYSIKFETIKDQIVDKNTVHTPQGKTPTVEEITKKITPPEGKTIKEVKIVENPDVNTPGNVKVKVIVDYTDGSSVGTNDKPLEVPVEVHKNIIPEAPGGQKPKDALDNYVKVILKAGEGGKFENTLTNQFVYYVSPEVEVDMTGEANKISKTPDTGYIVNGGEWKNKDDKALKGTFTDNETIFEYKFKKSTDIVEKIDENTKKPEGYVEVIFKADANGKLEGDKLEKIYYVNPKAGIKLVELADGQNATDKQLAVPKTVADTNYAFDKWFEEIDQTNPIKSDRVHVAQFKLNKVTLTYDAGGAEGTVPKSVTVDHGTKVELSAPIKLNKAYASFDGWKIGQKTYKSGEEITLTENCTAIAQWKNDEEIISYDPKDPITKPEGYVRVSFAAEEGLKLTEQKAYYVKKNAGIILGNEKLIKPTVIPEIGYKFDKWDKDDTTEIKDENVVVTAKATKYDDVIKKTKTDDSEKPDNYVKVTFKAGEHGTVTETTYFVNPNKYVALTPPSDANGKTGYEFATWTSTDGTEFSLANFINYKEDTEIIAKFNQKDSVFPNTPGSTKPAGYVEVEFAIDTNSTGRGKFEGITSYFVDPSRPVSIPTPTTVAGVGYMFDRWTVKQGTNTGDPFKPQEEHKYTEAKTIIYANFKKLEDIIPSINDDQTTNLKPDGYVTVYFLEGAHAQKIEGKSIYYVNPTANKKIQDLTKPTITPDIGWNQKSGDEAWLNSDNTKVENTAVINKDMHITAQYESISDFIEKTNDPSQKKPTGYVEVKFVAGANGKLKDGITEKVYYVNPHKYVQLKAPETIADNEYEFVSWSKDVRNYTKYDKDTTITANFNPKDKVIPVKPGISKPNNYVTVTFELEKVNNNDAGTIEETETTSFYVDSTVAVKLNPPAIDLKTGYDFKKWVIKTNGIEQDIVPQNDNKYSVDTTIYGQFSEFNSIIPSKEPNGDVNSKPKGYVTVTFEKGEHGVLDGQTIYYVNPKAGIKLGDASIAKPNVIAANTYVHSGWDIDDDGKANTDAEISAKEINKDITVKAIYTSLPPIIKAGPNQTAPSGYVVVIFKTDGKGTLLDNAINGNKPAGREKESEIVYFVNPNRNLDAQYDVKLVDETKSVSDTELPIPTPVPNDSVKTKFDKWIEEIDYTNPIKRGRVYVATFKPIEVTLTYDAGEATEGSAPNAVTVDYGTSVRLANEGNLTKKDAKFVGWKIGDSTHPVGAELTLTADTKAIAQWEGDKNVIEYDPQEPKTRPDDTYVRVIFKAEEGITLSNVKAYYVKKNANITLGNEEIIKPTTAAKTGFEFSGWDKDDSTVINANITVTAKSTPLQDTVEKKTGVDKPEGYVEVKFVAGPNGTVEEKTYYVNPNKYVTLTPPTATGNTGYEFGSWSQDAMAPTQYKNPSTTITAKFNQIDSVSTTKKPGYKKVEFVIEGEGGNIVDEETKVYYVDPNRNVTINPPKTLAKTGYVFEKWDQDTVTTAKKYAEDTTVKGNFKKLPDVVPSKDKTTGKDNAKPDGYVVVKFITSSEGKLVGETLYYVNPNANLNVNALEVPTVDPEVGYKQKKDTTNDKPLWKVLDLVHQVEEFDLSKLTINKDLTIEAQYDAEKDSIPAKNDDGTSNVKPKGYIKVTFKTTEKGGNIEKDIYVNPNKAVELKDQAPKVNPVTGYEFSDWDRPIKEKIQYTDGNIITAQFNEIGNISKVEKPGYVKVEFKQGEHGTLTGDVNLWIKPDVEVTIPAPKVNPNVGYEFDNWNKTLTVTAKENDPTYEITAQYKPLGDVIPQGKPDGSDKPNGYVTVTFKAVNGTLSGNTVYYVNGEKEVDLTSTADAITKKANVGYTADGGKWDRPLKATFKDGDVLTFTFKELPDAILKTKDDESERPAGYVKVTLIPTDKATDETKAEKVYFVNPLKKVTITETPVGTQVKDANDVSYDYKFTGWTVTRGAINSWKGSTVSDKFIQDTDITAKYSVEIGNIMPLPLAKDNAVTAINDTPEAKDLIKNPDVLPKGTTFAYADNGQPKVDQVGNVNAKVKVTYPNGKTSIVEVPVTVVDNVVPQVGNDRPLVPDSFIKVTVDPTYAATDNTNNKKIFWVKPNTEVKLDGIYDPIGKDIVEGNVKKPNKFTKWTLKDSDPVVEYKVVANSITTSFAKESTIIANYENVENIAPKEKDPLWFSLNSNPEPKDFIKNVYDDNDPKNPDNLPPGTKLEFVQDKEPSTGDVGQYSTTIKVTYPNGEVKTVVVPYKVTGDVVVQDGDNKPTVPDTFVLVIVKTTDKATEDITRKFWVNPKIELTIPVANPKGKYVPKDQGNPKDYTWKFTGWETEETPTRSWNDTITGQFIKETTINATYVEDQAELVDIYYTTESWKGVNDYLPREDQLKALVTSKVPGKVESVELLTDSQDFTEYAYSKLSENNINQINRPETINAKVTLNDGTVSIVEIPIVVYKNIYEGLTNGAKPQYVAQAEHDLRISNPNRDDNDYVRVTLIPTAKAKNQQRKTYYVRKNASVIIPEIIAEGRDAYQFIYWEAETPGKGQDNPNYGWATRAMSMFRSADPTNKSDLVNNGKIINEVDGKTRMSFNQNTDIIAQYDKKPEPWGPGYSGGVNIYIGKPSGNPTGKVKEPVAENEYRKEVRYMQGFNGNFRPNDGLTRAEAAQILANALVEDGFKCTENFKIPYKDVKEEWYTRAIRIVTEAKVFAGYDDGNFRPEKKITRNEWIATLKRFQELGDVVGNHMKLNDKHWAKSEIEAAFNEGWLSIYTDGLAKFKGDEFIPREEVAAVSNRAFNKVLDKDYIENNINNLITYKDVDKSRWSYYDILCASNTFIYQGGYYRAHWIKQDNDLFNVNTHGIDILKAEFQRNPR